MPSGLLRGLKRIHMRSDGELRPGVVAPVEVPHRDPGEVRVIEAVQLPLVPPCVRSQTGRMEDVPSRSHRREAESRASLKARPLPSEDVAAYVSQAVSTDVYRFRARVTVHAPAHVVSARLSGVAGRIEELGLDRCMVHTGGESLEGLAFHLELLGFDFEVHEPKELIEHLRRLAERFVRAAKWTEAAAQGLDATSS
jgi:hypothetical protein